MMSGRSRNCVSWRLLEFERASARRLMATDLYLYRTISRHPEPIAVRFYQFAPPAITIGYHQTMSRAVDAAACAAAGIDLARRPTGGRALLHRNELNYAVIADTTRAGIFGAGLAAGFCQISTAIADGLGLLGVQAKVSNEGKRPHNRSIAAGGGLCAATTTRYEITSSGQKLVAAAQLRSADRLLQHGTIYISETEVAPPELFGGKALTAKAHMSSMAELSGDQLNQDAVIQGLMLGFCRAFGPCTRRDSFDQVELEGINSLVANQKILSL